MNKTLISVRSNSANAGALKEKLRRLERYGKGKHHPSQLPIRSEASVIIFHLGDVEGEYLFQFMASISPLTSGIL